MARSRVTAAGLSLSMLVLAGAAALAQSAPAIYKGLEVSVSGVSRATNVSLTDCPPGANIVRGVIRPGDVNEFVSVTVDFKATPAFTPGPLAKPTLTGADGKVYNTAQSFAEVAGQAMFQCTFSFRVPKGAAVKTFSLETAAIDVSAMGK
ncbi:MAG: hypothetical protein R2745_15865 [Vicinamibacterales bacterium]